MFRPFKSAIITALLLFSLQGCDNGNYCCDFYGNCDPFCAAHIKCTASPEAVPQPKKAALRIKSVSVLLTKDNASCGFLPRALEDVITVTRKRSRIRAQLGAAGIMTGRIKRRVASVSGSINLARYGCTAEGEFILSPFPAMEGQVSAFGQVNCALFPACIFSYSGIYSVIK